MEELLAEFTLGFLEVVEAVFLAEAFDVDFLEAATGSTILFEASGVDKVVHCHKPLAKTQA